MLFASFHSLGKMKLGNKEMRIVCVLYYSA